MVGGHQPLHLLKKLVCLSDTGFVMRDLMSNVPVSMNIICSMFLLPTVSHTYSSMMFYKLSVLRN